VGRLRRPHGVKGELVMDVLTGFPERLHPGKEVYVGEERRPARIRSIRGHDKALLVSLEGVETPEAAGRFRNELVCISSAELPALPEGEFYHHELIGMQVLDEAGQALGELVYVLETGANDVYEVRTPDGKELLLPAVDEVILEVDLEQRRMTVRLPEWN
jgi:16S rRNA processing protein RimM